MIGLVETLVAPTAAWCFCSLCRYSRLVRGAHQGGGLSNQFLGHIAADALIHVWLF